MDTSWNVAVLALAVVAACESEITQPDGGGGSTGTLTGGQGGDGGTGGAGGEVSGCRVLEVAGLRHTLDSQVGSLFSGTLTLSQDEQLVFGYESAIADPGPAVTMWLADAWGAWPLPEAPVRHDFPDLGTVLAANGRQQGIALLRPGGGLSVRLFEDVVDSLPQGIELLEGSTDAHALAVGPRKTVAAYNRGLTVDDDYRFGFISVGADGTIEWQRDSLGCGGKVYYHYAAPAILLSSSGDPDLVAMGDVPRGSPCEYVTHASHPNQTRLVVAPLDANGQGDPIDIEEVPEEPVSSVGFVRREQGPLLVFARALPPNGLNEHDVYMVPLDWSGQPAGPVRSLGMRQVRERVAVVEVDQGFAVGYFPFLEEGEFRAAVALFDLEGNLLQEIDSAPLPDHGRNPMLAVASPDGRHIMLGWIQETGDKATENYGVPTLLRFDCVEPTVER